MERVDADEPADGGADETEGTEEGGPSRDHADGEKGEGQVEEDQFRLRQEENRYSDEKRQDEGPNDREPETRDWVTSGRGRPSGILATARGPFQRAAMDIGN